MGMMYLVVFGVIALLAPQATAQQPVYRSLACTGRRTFLSCPSGYTIVVQDAFYGRNDTVTCQDGSRDSTTQCSASGVKATLVRLCKGKQSCMVLASDAVFGTPEQCTPRTSKVLLVNYQCALARNTALVCGGSGRLTLTCLRGEVLQILSAFYGRANPSVCPHRRVTADTPYCEANSTLQVVNQTCWGLRECSLVARDGAYGDPCPDTYKYLMVDYACLGCVNRHSEDAECIQWALEGECLKNPGWMDNNCRKACRGCSGVSPKCENLEEDWKCDSWAGRGDCRNGRFVAWMMSRCRKSCTGCDKAATCQNTWQGTGNQSCWELEQAGECWKSPAFMLVNCAGQCLCPASRQEYIATVKCENRWRGDYTNLTVPQRDAECKKWVSEGGCENNVGFMFSNCFKACTNCTATPICENVADDATCDVYVEEGECVKNPLWMYTRCYKACTGCKPQPDCVNTHGSDAECEYWFKRGLCQSNPSFMMDGCWKTCSRCTPRPVIPVCNNDFRSDSDCDIYRNNTQCYTNPEWMLPYCRKACTFCSYPFLQLGTQGPLPYPGEASLMTTGKSFVMNNAFQEGGILSNFMGYFTNNSPVRLEIWRPAGLRNFTQVFSMLYTPTVLRGPQTVSAPCFPLKIGDRIGFSSINNLPAPVAYRFNLAESRNETFFRTSFAGGLFSEMKLPYRFSIAVAYDYTRTTC